jgi:hypothetical protein
MNTAPVLLLAYNRPEKLRNLINHVRALQPSIVLISVDGPKNSQPNDADLVLASQEVVQLIDWNAKIETRFRSTNLGLRLAVQDSVDWAISKYGKVVVIEDDAVPGTQLLDFFNFNLEKFATEDSVMHISGYNVVPENLLQANTGSRYSRYPESFAWATWDRSWKYYDANLTWGLEASVQEIAQITGSLTSAIRWKINFHDAATGRIGSWAYRWISSIWSQNGTTVVPNKNLLTYSGFDHGTHTVRRPRWVDLPIEVLSFKESDDQTVTDSEADHWTGSRVFRENPWGIADGVASSVVLAARKRWRSMKK